jgi:hypothetical protein
MQLLQTAVALTCFAQESQSTDSAHAPQPVNHVNYRGGFEQYFDLLTDSR